MLDILRQVNNEKLSAEEAVAELESKLADWEDLNPPRLVKQIKELEEEIEQLIV